MISSLAVRFLSCSCLLTEISTPASLIIRAAAFLPSPMALIAVEAPRMASPPIYTPSQPCFVITCRGFKILVTGKIDIRQLPDGRNYRVTLYDKFRAVNLYRSRPACFPTLLFPSCCTEVLLPCFLPDNFIWSSQFNDPYTLFNYSPDLSVVSRHLVNGSAIDDSDCASSLPTRQAVRAASIAVLPPPMMTTFLPMPVSGLPCAKEELQRFSHSGGIGTFNVKRYREGCP